MGERTLTEQLRFDGRVAIVTGGGGGLGRSYARLLAARGAHVVVNDIDRKDGGGLTPAGAVAAEIAARGGSAVAHDGSIAEPSAGPAVVGTALEAFGRVDIVVNNAGIVRDRTFGKMSDEEVAEVLDVHLHGTIGLTRAAWGVMRERRYGRVVMTTSVAGLWGNLGQANYSAAKAGLVGLGRTLAIEGARFGIQVNLISPGAATSMTAAMLPEDLHARMSPERVAPMVAYLCHESCPLTGEILFAAAGRYARNLIIETAGYENDEATVEDIAAHLPDILDTTSWTVPAQAVQLPPR
ncbi:SDR family NAD(P)-dependent oxidoreductase [Phytohabitans houttuyneae]|uniref:Short-chain dehydrogenase n=1 Tax=Phytohabitans houttuyneae TaxID=1076126 RepID=A0A6V8KAY9_9ACTN|nr:short-chain dehydrogenase [Phytohabitans houttuyneae]